VFYSGTVNKTRPTHETSSTARQGHQITINCRSNENLAKRLTAKSAIILFLLTCLSLHVVEL